MANAVETLASPSAHSRIRHRRTVRVPGLWPLWLFCRKKPLGAFGNGAVELYELTGHQSLPRHGVEIDMQYSLGEPIRQP